MRARNHLPSEWDCTSHVGCEKREVQISRGTLSPARAMGGREGARVCARAQRTTQQQPQPWRPSACLCLIPLSVGRRRRGFPFFFLFVCFLSKSTNAPVLTAAYLWTSPRLVRRLPIRRRSTGKRAEWEELKGEHDWGERPETDCEAAHPSLSLIQTRNFAVSLRLGIPRLPGSLWLVVSCGSRVGFRERFHTGAPGFDVRQPTSTVLAS